jgi:hypothetical protein
MKSATVLIIALCALGSTNVTVAQSQQLVSDEVGGAYPILRNSAAQPCVSDEQYKAIEEQCEANVKALDLSNIANKQAATGFGWPLRMAAGLNDCGYYGISGYVDQDTGSTIQDFNCGSNTYNGHKGTDIFTWPYPFYKMDKNQVEVIAAAAGIIVNKADGNFDRNCATNSLNPNYIAIQHADGSKALYLHMKSGSLTTKGIGASVVSGEFLGIVGSSGNSTGPHLHFEVWAGSTVATRIDPYSGTCNTLNTATWWTSQKAYSDPFVVKASVHKIAPVLPSCPNTETPNEDTCFAPGASMVFAIFMRDETIGSTVNMSLISPTGSVVTSWTHNCTVNLSGSYWTYNRTLPAIPGIYTFRSVYNGNTCNKNFKVDCNFVPPTAVGDINGVQSIRISPNPGYNTINLSGNNLSSGSYVFTLRDIMGSTVLSDHAMITTDHKLQHSLPIATLSQGVYFLTIESGGSKMVKQVIKLD